MSDYSLLIASASHQFLFLGSVLPLISLLFSVDMTVCICQKILSSLCLFLQTSQFFPIPLRQILLFRPVSSFLKGWGGERGTNSSKNILTTKNKFKKDKGNFPKIMKILICWRRGEYTSIYKFNFTVHFLTLLHFFM